MALHSQYADPVTKGKKHDTLVFAWRAVSSFTGGGVFESFSSDVAFFDASEQIEGPASDVPGPSSIPEQAPEPRQTSKCAPIITSNVSLVVQSVYPLLGFHSTTAINVGSHPVHLFQVRWLARDTMGAGNFNCFWQLFLRFANMLHSCFYLA